MMGPEYWRNLASGGAMKRRILILMAVLCGVILTSSPTRAISPFDDVLVQQAVKNLGQENYEEALEELTQAWEKGTRSPDKAYYLGVTYRRLLNYAKAREFLEQAVQMKPNYPEARHLLADTLLALDKPDQAMVQLKELEKSGYQPGQTAFLLGMAAMKQKRSKEALAYFRQAQADPAVAQEAKVQESLVLASLNRLKESQKTLKEAISLAPQSDMAGFAQRYAATLDRRLEDYRPFHFAASVGVDYDSNVTLQPGGASGASQVSGKGDVVYTQTAAMEYNFFPTGPFGLLSQYAYFQNFHPRITNYDVLSHTLGLVPMYQFQNGKLWMPVNYNYTDVQNDKYYTGFSTTPTYLYLLNPTWGLEVGGRAARKYYWFPISFPQDDRTAKNLGGSMGVYYFLKNQEGFLQARLSYEHDFAGGSNWDSSTYRLFLSALYPVTSRLKVSTFLDLMLQPFDHQFFNGAIYTPKRRDHTLIYGAQATYTIYRGLEFNVHYYLTRDDSNTPIYDYVRHIVGCQLGYHY
jgi:tetratricopeptide (TPR) repeat protein